MLFGIIFGLAGINLLFLPWFWIRLARRADDPVGEKRRKMFLAKTKRISRATSFNMEKAREMRARCARDAREMRARYARDTRYARDASEMRSWDAIARRGCEMAPYVLNAPGRWSSQRRSAGRLKKVAQCHQHRVRGWK